MKNYLLLIVISIFSISAHAEIILKNKGTDNNCVLKAFETKYTKKMKEKTINGMERLSSGSLPIKRKDYNFLTQAGFDIISSSENNYNFKEGDIYTISRLNCVETGEVYIEWKCSGYVTMYTYINGVKLKIASAKSTESKGVRDTDVGFSKLGVLCQ